MQQNGNTTEYARRSLPVVGAIAALLYFVFPALLVRPVVLAGQLFPGSWQLNADAICGYVFYPVVRLALGVPAYGWFIEKQAQLLDVYFSLPK